MRLTLLNSLILFGFFSGAFSYALERPREYHPNQFVFGFEPTRTNLPIALEALGASAKKLVGMGGKGVLQIEGSFNTRARDRYLTLLRKECPECKIKEVRESHGTLSYQVEFPDGYHFGSSLDAGALEWQTKPSSLPLVEKNIPRIQNKIIDLSKRAGANLRYDGLGGHVTFSGFGGDTFWYGNYLKFRANHPELDWGFFGKDSYNATPVPLWELEQQKQYAAVHAEHDARWSSFLERLESAVEKKTIDEDDLMKLYQERKVMTQEEYADRLLQIYENPKMKSWWNRAVGKRSKPKYVANKPAGHKIENRAIRPQASAQELYEHAKFIEAEAWFVKSKLNEGEVIEFVPGRYSAESSASVNAKARKLVEDLGLNWAEYSKYGGWGAKRAKAATATIDSGFTQKKYTALDRDRLFAKLRDRFLQKPGLDAKELVFLSDLMAEMSYTVPDSIKNAERLSKKLTPLVLETMTSSEVGRISANLEKLTQKFYEGTELISAPLQSQLLEIFTRSIEHPAESVPRKLVKSLSKDSRKSVLARIENAQLRKPLNHYLGVHADLLLSSRADEKQILAYLNTVNQLLEQLPDNQLLSLPARLEEVLAIAPASVALQSQIDTTKDSLIKRVRSQSNRIVLKSEEEVRTLKWLVEQAPVQMRAELLKPAQNYWREVMKNNRYGLENYYEVMSSYDELLRSTPEEGRMALIEELMPKVQEMHRIKADPDSEFFLESLTKEQKRLKSISVPCNLRFRKWFIK